MCWEAFQVQGSRGRKRHTWGLWIVACSHVNILLTLLLLALQRFYVFLGRMDYYCGNIGTGSGHQELWGLRLPRPGRSGVEAAEARAGRRAALRGGRGACAPRARRGPGSRRRKKMTDKKRQRWFSSQGKVWGRQTCSQRVAGGWEAFPWGKTNKWKVMKFYCRRQKRHTKINLHCKPQVLKKVQNFKFMLSGLVWQSEF